MIKDRVTISIPPGPYCNRPVTTQCPCLTVGDACQHPCRPKDPGRFDRWTSVYHDGSVAKSLWCLSRCVKKMKAETKRLRARTKRGCRK